MGTRLNPNGPDSPWMEWACLHVSQTHTQMPKTEDHWPKGFLESLVPYLNGKGMSMFADTLFQTHSIVYKLFPQKVVSY